MKHGFSEWSKQLAPEFRARFERELSNLEGALSEAHEATPRALRETRLRYLVIPETKCIMARAALDCAELCRESHPEDCGALCAVLKVQLKGTLPIETADLGRLLEFLGKWPTIDPKVMPVDEVVGQIERAFAGQPAPSEWRPLLENIRRAVDVFTEKKSKSVQTFLTRITNLCNASVTARLKADEGWADLMRDDIAAESDSERACWEKLLSDVSCVRPEPPATGWEITREEHPIDFTDVEAYWRENDRMLLARRAATEWKQAVDEDITAVGAASFASRRLKWLQAVPTSKPGTLSQFSVNREVLRALLWTCEHADDRELTRAIRIATEFLYRKNSPLGQTGVQILAHLRSRNCQEELTHLLNQVKSQSHTRLVGAAQELVAERTGMSAADLLLPDSGFTEYGRRVETLSGFTAELAVTQSGCVELRWFKPNEQPQKSIPAKVKREHADVVRDLKSAVKDVTSTLAKTRDRLESAPLEEQTWTVDEWRKRYFDHPVAGTVARRVLWSVEQDGETTIAAFDGRLLVDVNGGNLKLSPTTRVSVWHPIASPAEQVLACREWLLAREIRQSFKQAHREVYILTEAERETEVYSNRFAAHILKQSQFRALAKTRGWKTDYLGPWDGGDGGVATRNLPAWNLRAEFWTIAVGDEHAPAGGYLYLATDQVRFYRAGSSELLPLSDVPRLPFSEIMRDVDLFIGVCSVGNDPNWYDGGTDGRHLNYWHRYSFGELAETAVTRRAVLEGIIPRLKIADRCTLGDRFLVVRGNLRTYRIHIGSGNILMEPNDEYLCIVPASRPRLESNLFLPFEGDDRLSVVLSKALLLADDTSIKDPTIMSQIRGSTEALE